MQRFRWTTERISQRIFYVLVGLILALFALFYLVGYDLPYLFNPDLNAPLFTGSIVGLMMALLAVTVGFCCWGVTRSVRMRGNGGRRVNNIPVKRISYAVAGSLVGMLGLTFLLGSSKEMVVNGQPYADWLWLKASDMFIATATLLLVVAIATVLFGATRFYRKR